MAQRNEYDSLLESNEYDVEIHADSGRQALRESVVPALDANPDEAAEAKRLGTAAGLPAPVVERNLDAVRKQVQINDYDRLLTESPALAKHLSDKPDFARIAHDDTEHLSLTERVTKSFQRGLTGTLRGSDAMALQETAEMMGLLDRIERGEFADHAALEAASPYGRVFAGVKPEHFPAIRQHQEERFLENAVEFALRSGKIAGLPASPEYQLVQESGQHGFFASIAPLFDMPFRLQMGQPVVQAGVIPTALDNPKVAVDLTAESLGALAPTLPLIAAGGFAGGVPGLAAVTGASSAFTEFSNSLPSVFEELGVDLTDQGAVTAAVQTPEFKAKVRDIAIKAGVIGAFDAATAGVGAARLRPSAAGNLAAQTGVQAAGGAAGEAAGATAIGQEVDPFAVVAEAVGEVPTAAFDAGVLAVRQQMEQRNAAQKAEQDAQVLTQMAELVKASKVAERDPASFQAFVDAAAAEGPVQDVYIDARALGETLQQGGLEEFARAAPTAAAQIPEALASGGSVRIPLGEYAAGLAASDLNAKILPHLKTDPSGMSQVEAQEYMQSEAAVLKQQAEQILADKGAEDEFTQSAMKVETTILDQLTKANRFTGDVNKAYAALTRDFYTTTAARVGVTPEQLYKRYPLRVVAESVAGENKLDQSGLGMGLERYSDNALQAMAGSYQRRAASAEGEADRDRWTEHRQAVEQELARRKGGTLAQPAYHGTPHDIGPEGFKLDKIGTGEGAQAYGWGLYFAENPAVARGYQERLSTSAATVRGKTIDIPRDGSAIIKKGLTDAEHWVARAIAAAGAGSDWAERAVSFLQTRVPLDEEMFGAIKDAQYMIERGEAAPVLTGGIYKVDIDDTAVAKMLDWDKPLNEQPESVKAALKKALPEFFENRPLADPNGGFLHGHSAADYDTGAVAYAALVDEFAPVEKGFGRAYNTDGQRKASEYLRSLGIPGLRYLDQGSRNTKDGTRNLVVFDEKIIKITHKDGTPVTAAERKEYFQSTQPAQPTFYSGLQRAIEGVKQGKAPASQWMGLLKNLPGVKAEEMEWVGLEEWLAQQSGSVTKEQVLDFVRANAIEVEEKTLGGEGLEEITSEVDDVKVKLDALGYSVLTDNDRVVIGVARRSDNKFFVNDTTDSGFEGDAPVSDLPPEVQELFERANELTSNLADPDTDADSTKFGTYTLPGAKEGSYRELLLTLPPSQVGKPEPLTELPPGYSPITDDSQGPSRRWGVIPPGQIHARPMGSRHATEAEALEEALMLVNNERESKWRTEQERHSFSSGHFDTPNILAHIRFNERTDADSKRVLFIEEIQSDWHQKGRREGYARDTKGWTAKNLNGPDAGFGHWQVLDADGNEVTKIVGSGDAQGAINKAAEGIPDAPFKTTWPMLAFKRALRWAVDNGFERIAWTTGEQQADRYDLSKQISKITYNAPGGRMAEKFGTVLKAFDKGGNQVINKIATPEELPDLIGKEAAKKLLESKPDGSQHELAGVDLRIGGEGMRAFYDDILPREVGKYVKKWGGKVGRTVIGHDRFKVKQDRDGSWYYEDEGESGEGGFPTRQDAELAARADNEREDRHNVHSLDITPQMQEAALAGQPMFQRTGAQPRGLITFDDITEGATIQLMKNADLSTFLHESGHFYLEVLAHLASDPQSPVAGDMQTVLDWFGVKDLATWQGMSLKQKTVHHEKFARGFEAYLFEGNAPSVELKSLFARFKAWMLNVYKTLTALSVELSPEVRGVFDRLLASEQQIAEAEAAAGAFPLFKSPEDVPSMKLEEFASYQALGAQATGDANSDLQRRSLRDMQWLTNARGRTLKALQRDAEAKRKAIQTEVKSEVDAMSVYAAMRFLKTGELPDGRTLDVHRLQVSAIEEMYPAGRPAYEWQDLGKGSGGMTGVNGITPDQAAELLGFTSGDHLIRDILAAQPQEQVVEGLTDQRMLERYGDLASPEALQRAANEAVHNEARMRFVAAELNALAKATGGRKVLARAAKEFAAAIVARKRVRDIKPAQYTSAEARASRAAEAALKAGALAEAAVEKRNQLVNGYAGRAAHEAIDEVEKGVRYLRKFAGPVSLDPEYAEQIHTLLGRFDLRRITNREADRRATLAEWVNGQQELGFEPVIDEALLDEAKRKPYREMTLEEFRGLIDTVRNIEHLGRLKKRLLTAASEREFEAAVQEAAASIRANAKGTKPVKLESNTKMDAAAEGVGQFFAMHRKFASLLRELDGVKDGGAMWELLMRPLNKAADGEAVMREKATMALDKILTKKVTEGMRQKVYIPEIGNSLSKEGRLSIALYWGSPEGRQRVMGGDGWTPDQVQAILNTLTRADLEAVRELWAFNETYWPMIAEKEKRVSGVVPPRVEAAPFEVRTADGQVVQMPGGYHRIKYDPKRSSKAEAQDMAASMKQAMQGAFTRAMPRNGFTKARAEEVTGRPVRKDLGVLFENVTEVIHNLSFHEYLIDATRLLRAGAIDSAIREHYGPEVLRQLKNALTDVAAGDVPAQNVFERSVNHLRMGATIAGLAWNVTTAAIQPLGLTQSMVRIGPKWVGRGIARWMRDAGTMESTAGWIYGKSDFMRLRGKTLQREISEIRNKVSGKETAVQASFFYFIQQMQKVVDIPTWLGAYEKAMADSANDEARAIALADQAVLDSQGGGQIKDLAAIQRGSPLQKAWTNFYSYFSTTYNLAAERTKATKFSDPLSVGRLAVDYLLLFTVPAALGAVIRTALKPGDEWDDLPERLAREQLNYLMGTMVLLRELGTAINGFAGYSGPAGLRFFAEISKLYRQVAQGEVDEPMLKALNAAAGIYFHYPAGQVQRTVEGAIALAEGDTKNPLAVVTGAPK